ncbi:DUF5943 domain-containing protein [Paraburkholderia bonniea]|uniref:4-vinyl reductase n=1 Tax=Paraburkholderia bonniea TaxID=2152891 RepID=UPI001292456A|nr:4-vinyl reductase [Paraburkholderia bonniea]WJF91508.1 DUF5943 domain-containing protein [Paraburkholderia bonniea]WJF94827.1 DUF5943 domain-containing protein [Paraburkholderia bonniea]
MHPQLPIDVDADTGVWTTDALAMLYVPRHFFTNNHLAVEDALGQSTYAAILYQAGYKSAWHWCNKEAALHGMSGMAVYEHYLQRLSQRGWGRFSLAESDPEHARARIELRHSSFVLAQPDKKGKLCYMFSGWFAGAMDWVNDAFLSANAGAARRPRSYAAEVRCCAQGHGHCVFEVKPIAS